MKRFYLERRKPRADDVRLRNEVHVLFDGYSHVDPDDKACQRANCSCSLVQTKSGKNIIVDTMTAWDTEKLTEALKQHNLEPKDIWAVVCTHGHADHVGCNSLFTAAEYHFVGTCMSNRDKFYDHFTVNCAYHLVDEDVVVYRTPGHTITCVSLIVRDTQFKDRSTVGIVGDLFEHANDIEDESLWVEAGSEDPKLQRESRAHMAAICDFLVPGHGPMFPVTEDMRHALRSQFKKQNNNFY